MAFFAGSYIEGSFFKAIFFPKIMNCPCFDFVLLFRFKLKNINRTKAMLLVTFLLTFEKTVAFWALSSATY